MSLSMTSQTCSASSPNRIFSSSIVRNCNVNLHKISSYLFHRVIIVNGKKSCREVRLKLIHDDFLGLIDADKRANNIGSLASSEL